MSNRCWISIAAISGMAWRRGSKRAAVPEPNDLRDRRKNLQTRRLPHLAAVEDGIVVGYTYVVPFRKRPAYRFTVKHSIYVRHDRHGRGIGAALMQALIDACAAAGFRRMIGYIDADNAASLGLHDKFGFSPGPACCQAAPIAMGTGPTRCWSNARSAPVPRQRRRRFLFARPASCNGLSPRSLPPPVTAPPRPRWSAAGR